MENRGYFAVIPANVRYANIPNGAKLLFGEITALCNEKGYCWATNSYFAELYGVDTRTIVRWINALEKNDFIKKDIIYKPNSREVDKRIIELGVVTKMSLGSDKNVTTPHDKNVTTPGDKNVTENNTYINNTSVLENTLANKELICECVPPSEDPELIEELKQNVEDIHVQQVVNEYKRVCKNFNQIQRLTEGRKQKIKARLKTYSVEDIFKCFKIASESNFMRGSPKGWKASFDWFIDCDENIAKVLEGNYSNEKSSQKSGFNNYKQRDYNMKELEKKLINTG